MNEEERAERFARDLDQFLFGGIDERLSDLDDHDLSSLFDVARRRVDKSEAARQQAERYESDAWEKLLSGLNPEDEPGAGHPPAIDSDAVDSSEMRDVISLRRQIAEDALSLAEQHREDVWNRISGRVADDNGKRQPVLATTQATHSQHSSFTAADPGFDSLVRIALGSAHAPPRDPEMTERLWARVGGLPNSHDLERSLDERWTGTSVPVPLTVKAVGFAAAVVLLVAVIGPLPLTGFADHPFIEVVNHLAGATGVIKPNDPPSDPPSSMVPPNGDATTNAEAAALLGLSVANHRTYHS